MWKGERRRSLEKKKKNRREPENFVQLCVCPKIERRLIERILLVNCEYPFVDGIKYAIFLRNVFSANTFVPSQTTNQLFNNDRILYKAHLRVLTTVVITAARRAPITRNGRGVPQGPR